MYIPKDCEPYIKCHRTEIMGDLCLGYVNEIEKDFKEIEGFLPEEVGSVLDIGCGLAGIDVFLRDKYPDAKFYFLDSDGSPTDNFGFNQEYKPYTLRSLAERVFGKPTKWFDVGTKEALEADIVISLLSWGYHYPITAYSPDYKYLIVDIRDNTLNLDEEFPNYKLIRKGENYARIFYTQL